MTILDEFTRHGRFTGKKQDYPTEANLDSFLKEQGQEWVAGYMKAVEAMVVEISDILMPSDDICGVPQTPHMVRTNLKKYWTHNKLFLVSYMDQIKPSSDGKCKNQPL